MLLFYFLLLSSSLPVFLLDSISIAVIDLLIQGNIMMELDVLQHQPQLTLKQAHLLVMGIQPINVPVPSSEFIYLK